MFFLLLIINFLSIFTSVKAQDINFNNYFFDNDVTFYSLSNFIKNDNIIIYDENEKLGSNESQYKHQSNSVNQSIKIISSLPKIQQYLLLSDYIINDNLAVISFSDSNNKNYIIYTFKRKSKNDKWWSLLSIYNGSMN